MARAALANAAGKMGEPTGRPGLADAARPRQGVDQAEKSSTQDAGRPPASSPPSGGSGASASRPAPQESRLMRAVRLAATDAVPRQAGLAPLMADVRAVLDRPDTPSEIRTAGEILLARLPQTFEVSTAGGLKKAVEQSGVFLEARLARTNASSPHGDAAPGLPATDLKAALLVFKGELKDWLVRATPPMVEEPGAETPIDPLPDADQLVETRTSSAVVSSETQPQDDAPAEAASTLTKVLEASLADDDASTPPQTPSNVSPVGRSGDGVPIAELAPAEASVVEDEVVEPRFAAFLASSTTPTASQPGHSSSSALGLLGLAEVSPSAAENRPSAPVVARGYGAAVTDPGKPNTPPPPFADGPMAGQRPMSSQLPAQAALDEIVRGLLKGASAALARQDLMQIASLREVHYDPETGEVRPQPARLNLDVPFVTPQGVAVAQFEITRDGGGAGGPAFGPAERSYRARFSIDMEPLGAVHALVTLTGSRARVSLWAERAETIARLRAGEETLGAALRQAELSPEVSIHSGPPPLRDASALGHFVDQAS
jgi:hypothetical protein